MFFLFYLTYHLTYYLAYFLYLRFKVDKILLMYYNKAMTKKIGFFISLILLFIISLGIIPLSSPPSNALSEGGQAKVIVSRTYLYTADNFSSEKVSYEDGENTILVTLKHGDTLTIESFSGDFAYVNTTDEKSGYIYKYYISDNTSQEVYPVFNASIRKDTKIYDIEQNETEFTAKKGSRVYIYQGFNDKKEYTAVQIVLDDQTLYNGYILTSDIKPDGVSGLLIVAITIIVAAVTIILSLLFIKKKKKSKKGE